MNTYIAPNGTKFYYNSDFSGTINIVTPGSYGITEFVNGHDLLAFVAYCYVQRKLVEQVEGMTWRELLGVLTK